MKRRTLLAGALGTGLVLPSSSLAQAQSSAAATGRLLDAGEFGATGDGVTDDSAALQLALNALFAENRGGVLTISPGIYRIASPIRVAPTAGTAGNITGGCIVRAHGVRLVSDFDEDAPAIEIVSQSVIRFVTIEGLEIKGGGKEAGGLWLTCETRGAYLYNFCLRDLVIQNCGGDGLRMTGNLFEGQIFNSYFRDNKGNGATFAHGGEDTVLSAVHAFGCVFGGNRLHGAELRDGAEDVGFQGCYFLLNGKFGVSAPNGCTLLSHCGFENNQRSAGSFEAGGAGIRLQVKGLLVGCTAYSIEYQTHLLDAFVTQDLTMVGCTAGGTGKAANAGLAQLQGSGSGEAILIGTRGRVDDRGGVEILNLDRRAAGNFPSEWDDKKLLRLGEYRIWVDAGGTLRIKQGTPSSDEDGKAVGA